MLQSEVTISEGSSLHDNYAGVRSSHELRVLSNVNFTILSGPVVSCIRILAAPYM